MVRLDPYYRLSGLQSLCSSQKHHVPWAIAWQNLAFYLLTLQNKSHPSVHLNHQGTYWFRKSLSYGILAPSFFSRHWRFLVIFHYAYVSPHLGISLWFHYTYTWPLCVKLRMEERIGYVSILQIFDIDICGGFWWHFTIRHWLLTPFVPYALFLPFAFCCIKMKPSEVVQY